MPRFTLVPVAAALVLLLGACSTGASAPEDQTGTGLSPSSTTTEAGGEQAADDLADLLDQDAEDSSVSPTTSGTNTVSSTTSAPGNASVSDTSSVPGSTSTPDSTSPPSTTTVPGDVTIEGDCVALPDVPSNCFPLLRSDGEIILVEPLSDDEYAEFEYACIYQDQAEACEVLDFLGIDDGLGTYYAAAPIEILEDACENLTGVNQKLACAEVATR